VRWRLLGLTAAGDDSCSFVGMGVDSKVWIGTRSGGGRIDAACGGGGRIVEAGKAALLGGESTRRVVA